MTRSKALLVAALLFVAVAVFVGGAAASPARSAARNEKQLTSLNRQIALLINHFRRSHGRALLRGCRQLNASARQHSKEMGADGYFDHPSANGTPFWKRIQKYYSSKNYSYWTVGENLLFSSSNITAREAVKMWIKSPEHLRNLLDPNWRNLGVSALYVTHAGGVYGNGPVTIITTDFGARH